LRQDAVTPTPCCAGFNTNIDQFASQYPNCGLASSAGLSGNGADAYHFNCAGMRELGRRYALALLAHASSTYIPRKGSTNTINERVVMYQAMKSATSSIRVYSLNGRVIRSYSATDAGNAFRNLNTGGVYIVSRKLNDGRMTILPFVKE
jgi:hypothetical protein